MAQIKLIKIIVPQNRAERSSFTHIASLLYSYCTQSSQSHTGLLALQLTTVSLKLHPAEMGNRGFMEFANSLTDNCIESRFMAVCALNRRKLPKYPIIDITADIY